MASHSAVGLVLPKKFSPNLPHYLNVLKRLSKLGEILLQVLRNGKSRGKFIIDSTAFRLCLRVRRFRYKSIREAMGRAISSTKTTFGFKANFLTNLKGSRIENIAFSKGSVHDGHSPWRAYYAFCAGGLIARQWAAVWARRPQAQKMPHKD